MTFDLALLVACICLQWRRLIPFINNAVVVAQVYLTCLDKQSSDGHCIVGRNVISVSAIRLVAPHQCFNMTTYYYPIEYMI